MSTKSPWWLARIPSSLDAQNRRAFVAFNKVVDRFESDHDLIFSDRSETLRRAYAFRSKSMRAWQTSRRCAFDGCTRMSVAKSHTIPKTASLNVIAENGHVVTPVLDPGTGKVQVATIGVGAASVFPGFCRLHEASFSEFEKAGDLTDDRHFALQIYRTICREVVSSRFHLESGRRLLREHLTFRDRKLRELMMQELGPDFEETSGLKNRGLKVKCSDRRFRSLHNQCRRLEADLRYLQKALLVPAAKDAKEGVQKRIAASGVALDVTIPVALAGRGDFGWSDGNGRPRSVVAILSVLPMAGAGTYVVMATSKQDEPALDWYFNHFSQNGILLLNMIESWMMYGTDHWFLSPSVWHAIRDEVKEKLLRDYTDTRYDIASPCPYTLFNHLKREGLRDLAEASKADEESSNARVLPRRELAKLSDMDSSPVGTQ